MDFSSGTIFLCTHILLMHLVPFTEHFEIVCKSSFISVIWVVMLLPGLWGGTKSPFPAFTLADTLFLHPHRIAYHFFFLWRFLMGNSLSVPGRSDTVLSSLSQARTPVYGPVIPDTVILLAASLCNSHYHRCVHDQHCPRLGYFPALL